MTLTERARSAVRTAWARLGGARGYRYEGEQASHADALREREVSLALMASPGDDPDRQRMATEIEGDAENRLVVLLGKPRLTLEEKRERDAIQAALAARRQSFSAGPGLERRAEPWRPQGFLAPLGAAAVQPWMLWTGALAAVGAAAVVQTARLNNAKHDLSEARVLARQNFDAAQGWRERAEQYRLGLVDAAAVARHAADALEAERQRQARAAARERRRQREIQNVIAGSPDAPDWRLRSAADASESDAPAANP